MTITVTDLFCGAGGSSLGAEAAGAEIVMAANHLPTITAGGNHHGLVVRSVGFEGSGSLGRFTSSTDDPLPICLSSRPDALLMRNYSSRGGQDGGEMVSSVDDPTYTQTGKLNQALLVPEHVDVERMVDECGFRMLEPHEIAAAMAFPTGYIPDELPKKDRVKLAGNAVTPPVMTWLAGRVIRAIEEAA